MLDLPAPPMPQRVVNCDSCNGLGILDMTTTLPTDNLGVNLSTAGQPAGQHQPTFTGKICVIGGGIGGLAFALAGLHRGLDVTVYEKDADFTTRSQVSQSVTISMSVSCVIDIKIYYLSQLTSCV